MAQPDYEQPKEGEEIVDISPDTIEVKPLDITQDSVLNRPLILGGNLSAAKGTFTSLYANAAEALTIDYGGDILLKHGGDIKFTSVTAPTACTATLITAAGNVDAGTHTYKVTYVTTTGETGLGTASNTITTDANNKQVALSAIPISTSGAVTKRKIYRTKAGGTNYYLLTTINNNTGTTYTDNTADADLTGGIANNRENNTFGRIIIDGITRLSLGAVNTFMGQNSGYSNTTGNSNSAVGSGALLSNTTGSNNSAIGVAALYYNTTGSFNSAMGEGALYDNTNGKYNSAIGEAALFSNTTGNENSAMGESALFSNTTGSNNTAVGDSALLFNGTGSNNTAIGYYSFRSNETGTDNVGLGYKAGYYETGSNKLFIDNASRANEADGRIKALIYGVFAAATANQKLTINGLLNQSVSKTPAAANAAGTAGDICWDASYIYVCVSTGSWKRVAIAAW